MIRQQPSLGHGTEDRIVSTDGRSVFIVVCLGVTHLEELRLNNKHSIMRLSRCFTPDNSLN